MLKKYAAAVLLAAFALQGAFAGEISIAVLDFACIDIQGQKFYEFKDKKLQQGKQDSLSPEDRQLIDDRMLGMVKMLDAQENSDTRRHERLENDKINERDRKRRDELADKIMKSPQRTLVIGAEYMCAALGKYPQFKVLDSDAQIRALKAIRAGRPSNDSDIGDFGKFSGAQYLLYGIVADFQTRNTEFSGYGVKTKNTIYTLDVLIRVVNVKSGKTVFSRVFSGSDREMTTEELKVVDSARYERLLKRAVSEAAEELNREFPAQGKEAK